MSRRTRRQEELEQTVYPSDPYTFIKHRAYRHYLNCWLAVFLQSWDEAAVVDAFAGAGVYSDGEPGSSVVVGRSLLEHASLRRFKGALSILSLEERRDRSEELSHQLGKLGKNPKLTTLVHPPDSFERARQKLSARAHHGDIRRPALWLLDPYGPADLPVDVVRACMDSGPRDEVIISFFAREMYRRRDVAAWQAAMARHFGNDAWKVVRDAANMTSGMESLVEAYQDAWRASGLYSGRFAIKLPNEGIRYYLVFLTHAAKGLECWTKMCRRMDDYMGAGASPVSADQASLFAPPTGATRAIILTFANQEVSWQTLRVQTMQAGQSDSILRAALTELNSEGLVFRVSPLETRSPWPQGCAVRVYSPEAVSEPED